MDRFLEAVKLIGSFLGIATTFFIVLDRVFRDRPIFALHISRPAGASTGRENDIYVRIKNVVDEDIVIDDLSITPASLTLAADHEIRSMVKALVGEFSPVVVGPLQETVLTLMVTLPEGHQAENDPVTITATWRGTRRPWPWKRHVRIRTTVASIRKLKSAVATEEYERARAS